MDETSGCENCEWRSRFDANPGGLLGRIWRWHAGWCPGWKRYITSLPDDERRKLAGRYGMKKYAE